MVFVKHTYGFRKQDVVRLLRKRLSLKEKLRYHERKLNELKRSLDEVERKVEDLEKL